MTEKIDLYMFNLDHHNSPDISLTVKEWKEYYDKWNIEHHQKHKVSCNVVKTIKLNPKEWMKFRMYFDLPRYLWRTMCDDLYNKERDGSDYNVIKIMIDSKNTLNKYECCYIVVPSHSGLPHTFGILPRTVDMWYNH